MDQQKALKDEAKQRAKREAELEEQRLLKERDMVASRER